MYQYVSLNHAKNVRTRDAMIMFERLLNGFELYSCIVGNISSFLELKQRTCLNHQANETIGYIPHSVPMLDSKIPMLLLQ